MHGLKPGSLTRVSRRKYSKNIKYNGCKDSRVTITLNRETKIKKNEIKFL